MFLGLPCRSMPGSICKLASRMRDPTGIVGTDGKVRILRKRCATCVFRKEGKELFGENTIADLIERNVATGALLTCHATLPYGDYPDFGPAACAGFWARFGRATAAGVIAKFLIGIVRPMPPTTKE